MAEKEKQSGVTIDDLVEEFVTTGSSNFEGFPPGLQQEIKTILIDSATQLSDMEVYRRSRMRDYSDNLQQLEQDLKKKKEELFERYPKENRRSIGQVVSMKSLKPVVTAYTEGFGSLSEVRGFKQRVRVLRAKGTPDDVGGAQFHSNEIGPSNQIRTGLGGENR